VNNNIAALDERAGTHSIFEMVFACPQVHSCLDTTLNNQACTSAAVSFVFFSFSILGRIPPLLQSTRPSTRTQLVFQLLCHMPPAAFNVSRLSVHHLQADFE
jgi:hypothetical protein